MNFFVTGGAGFIGSNFIQQALNQGHSIIAVDNFSTGLEKNIEPFLSYPNFKMIKFDLAEEFPKSLRRLTKSVDQIFHFAASVGVENVIKGASNTIKNNLRATENIIEIAKYSKTPVIFTSTSEVYGKSPLIPSGEDSDRIMGAGKVYRWAYAETKILDELLMKELWEFHRIPTVTLRLFNTVGSNQSASYGMVIPRFVAQALAEEPLTVYGTGNQIRTFCDVRDVVNAIFQIKDNESAFGEVFNVGSEDKISILELANKIKYMTKSSSRILQINPNQKFGLGFEEIDYRCPNISKINKLINWRPEISLDQTIKEVINYKRSTFGPNSKV